MLTENALIFFVALAGCGLLLLGVLELVWPTRSRRTERRRPPGLRAQPLALGDCAIGGVPLVPPGARVEPLVDGTAAEAAALVHALGVDGEVSAEETLETVRRAEALLARALAHSSAASPDDGADTRALLARALDGLVTTCADVVRRLAESGEVGAAEAGRDRLRAVLAAGAASGDEEVQETVDRVERLFEGAGFGSRR